MDKSVQLFDDLMTTIFENDNWKSNHNSDAVIQGAIEVVRDNKQNVGNLLAAIHRDGGHYISEHGLTKAFKEAELLITENRVAYTNHKCPRPTVYLQIGGIFAPFKSGHVIKDVILTEQNNVRLVVDPQEFMQGRYERTDAYSRVKV